MEEKGMGGKRDGWEWMDGRRWRGGDGGEEMEGRRWRGGDGGEEMEGKDGMEGDTESGIYQLNSFIKSSYNISLSYFESEGFTSK